KEDRSMLRLVPPPPPFRWDSGEAKSKLCFVGIIEPAAPYLVLLRRDRIEAEQVRPPRPEHDDDLHARPEHRMGHRAHAVDHLDIVEPADTMGGAGPRIEQARGRRDTRRSPGESREITRTGGIIPRV